MRTVDHSFVLNNLRGQRSLLLATVKAASASLLDEIEWLQEQGFVKPEARSGVIADLTEVRKSLEAAISDVTCV